MKNQEIIEKLKNITLFQEFADDSDRLTRIAESTVTIEVKAGDEVIREGEEGDTLYIILEGSVKILKRTLQDELYTVVHLKANENIYFGEIALIDSDKRSATVVAETNCRLIRLNRKDFLAISEEDPWLGYKVTMQIAKKLTTSLRKMNTDVITLFEALVAEVEGEDAL
jgi:CRP-like cAMP-binding protein